MKAIRSSASMDEVQAILACRYPGYEEPLGHGIAWNRQKSPESLAKAHRLLGVLKQRYPHVLQVRSELALCLVGLRQRDAAIRELKEAAALFEVLDEDVLCLWGRCHKDQGDEALANAQWVEAERSYRDAQDKYQRAFALSDDRFPGINVATLNLVLASVVAAQEHRVIAKAAMRAEIKELRQASEEMARELLDKRSAWKQVLADDNIWVLATEAEARLLLRDWHAAAECYRAALREPNVQRFHSESMQLQVARVLQAFSRLGVSPRGDFARLCA